MGLISASDRQAGTRIYKEYSTETVERLLMINQGKGLGFTLSEIGQLINEWGNDGMPKLEQIQIIELKLEEISGKTQKLDEIKAYLSYLYTNLSRLKPEFT